MSIASADIHEGWLTAGKRATAGDAAYIPGSVSGEIRNEGQEMGSGLVVLVGPTEAMTGATPTS